MRQRILLTLIVGLAVCFTASAQRPQWNKMSPMLRQLVRTKNVQPSSSTVRSAMPLSAAKNPSPSIVYALVKTTDRSILSTYGCHELAHVGSISIASIPVDQLAALSLDRRVLRMEAHPMGHILMDSVNFQINALPAREGQQLPQAFTGKDVVVGVMDIGFDLTHPNFYDRSMQNYRIRRLWDMLSVDTIGSPLPVGRDYVTTEALLTLAHSRDGLDQTHGTHTLGSAAGSGYDTKYQGIAPESDICLVANAVSENVNLIDSADLGKFTYATDALGFKYIFDYATSVGKPCVISFSEGSTQDFHGYDVLFYELLDSLLGPGRILVSAAGNQGYTKSWFHKSHGEVSTGSFIFYTSHKSIGSFKSTDPFQFRITSYEQDTPVELSVTTADVLAQPDSLLTVRTSDAFSELDSIQIEAYSSCYNAQELCFDLTLFCGEKDDASTVPLSFEVIGSDADVEYWRSSGKLYANNELNPALNAGEYHHNILSPSSSPRVICVGSTMYRQGVTNYKGEWKHSEMGGNGMRSKYSSIGPTMDGRIKPDVVAPGTNVISSYSSYYLENHPDAGDITWDVAHFPFQGRTYAWNSNSGTSMSCPAAAGVIALWLQAKPDLTPEDVLDVIAHTSHMPADAPSSEKNNVYGYGEIDAYRGLLYILGIDGIDEVSANHTKANVNVSGGRLQVRLPQEASKPASLRIFNLSGRQVYQTVLPAHQLAYDLALPSLPAGIYAIQIEGEASGSTLIRL